MTTTQLRAALNAAGYPGAEIINGVVIVRDRDDLLNYREHRDVLQAAGIPVRWGGWSIGGGGQKGFYGYSVKLEGEAVV